MLRRSGATAVVAPEPAGARPLLEEAAAALDLAVHLSSVLATNGGSRSGAARVGEVRHA